MNEEELAAQAAAKAEEDAATAEAEALAALKAKQEAGDALTDDEAAKLAAKNGDDDEIVVTLGDATPEPEEKAPAWVKDLRAQHKEQARRLRELEEENRTLKAPQGAQALGAKPTLEGCDYDEAKFERDLTAWHEAKRRVESEKQAKTDAEAAEKKAWQDKLNAYEESKKELKIADFEDAESVAQMRLSTTQQGIILHGASKPSVLIYALGKNPAELERIAAIEDPVKFAFAVAQLEATVKTTSRKAPPAPEKQPPAGGKSGGASLDNTLERLREEAAKTGNYTKLHQYKKDQAAKAK